MAHSVLQNAEESGLYYLPPARRAAVELLGNQLHFCQLTAEITESSSTKETLSKLGSALKFPIWYGANFDALFDCLADPDWLPAKGHVLLINGISHLRSADPEDFATLIEVFQAAVEARQDIGNPFWVLIDAPARGVHTLPEA